MRIRARASQCYLSRFGLVDPCGCELDRRQDCLGNPELVSGCAATERRMLRLVSPDAAPPDPAAGPNEIPWPQSMVLVVCPD